VGSRVITLTVTHTVAPGYTGADRISGSVTLGNDAVGLMTANIRSWYWEPRPRRLAWDPRWAGTDAGHRNDAASWGGQERLLSLDQFLRLQICGPGFDSHFLRQFEDGAAGDSFEQIVAGREQGLAGDDRNIKAGAFRDVSLNSTAASAP
jgi:hypothetical protein